MFRANYFFLFFNQLYFLKISQMGINKLSIVFTDAFVELFS